VGISREFWGLGKFFQKKGNISNLNLAFTRFDTEQWWDGFSWWFWIWAFPSMNILFYILFYGKYVLSLSLLSLLLNPTYLVGLDVLIGDRLEKSVLSLMGLMRTDPPFLRRENKVVKKIKTEREIKRAKLKVVTILRKKMWKTWRRKKIITDNDHSLRQIFHLVLFEFFSWRGDNRGGGFRAG